MATVDTIYRYPLKGGEPERITSTGECKGSPVDRFGPVMDHRVAVIDERTGKILDQKAAPDLATIGAGFTLGAEHLQLMFRGDLNTGIALPLNAPGFTINIYQLGEMLPAKLLYDAAARELLNAYFGSDGQLTFAKFDDRRGDEREIDTDYAAQIGDFGRPAFHNGSPFHIISRQTTYELSHRALGAGFDINLHRWRANLVVDAERPFEEDEWVGKRIKIGNVVLRVYRRTPRCAIPGVNQETGQRDINVRELYESLDRTLPAEHSGKPKVMAGVYASHENPGVITPGDKVEILSDII